MDLRTLKRLKKEYDELLREPIPHCKAHPMDFNQLAEWEAVIEGPEETPYVGGLFHLHILFPNEYPFRPPKIIFKTRVYHPNISSTGGICLDILKDAWSPALTIGKILLSICSLLADPNPNDPLMPDIARIYIENNEQFVENATEYTQKFAMENDLHSINK